MKSATVIIPTYNRLPILEKCLAALSRQSVSGPFEVVLIDDGSTDQTPDLGQKLLKKFFPEGKFLRQENAGPSAARNRGIREALGEILIFIGDDILATPSFVESHLAAHERADSPKMVVIGKTEWDPEIQITEFMRILDRGVQFDFDDPESGRTDYRHCYTSNISVGKHFLIDHGLFFDEKFPYAAYEDIEWGYRMEKKQAQFIFAREALGLHHHPVTMESYCRRMENAGKALSHLSRLHPEMVGGGKRKSYVGFLRKQGKAKLREFILNHEGLHALLKKAGIGRNVEKWVKSILAYYEERGYFEENGKH